MNRPFYKKNLSRGTILLIDDDKLVEKTLSAVLKSSGYETLCVNNGADAIKTLHTHDVDIVITELHLPLISGWQVIEIIRDSFSEIPIFILTGYVEELIKVQHDRLESLGVNEILLKPVRIYDLLDRIALYATKEELRELESEHNSAPISPFL